METDHGCGLGLLDLSFCKGQFAEGTQRWLSPGQVWPALRHWHQREPRTCCLLVSAPLCPTASVFSAVNRPQITSQVRGSPQVVCPVGWCPQIAEAQGLNERGCYHGNGGWRQHKGRAQQTRRPGNKAVSNREQKIRGVCGRDEGAGQS